MAASAGVHTFVHTKEFDLAEALVKKFILNPQECTDDNELMFIAASRLYEATGKKKEKKQIDKSLKVYEKYVGKLLMEE